MCKKIFTNYVHAGYPLLWVQSHEEYRVLLNFVNELNNLEDDYSIFTWDRIDKIKEYKFDKELTSSNVDADIPLEDPLVALTWAEKEMPENSVLLLKDFHNYVKKDMVNRKIRNLIPLFKATHKILALISYTVDIPHELEKEITVIKFDLPNADELRDVLKGSYESALESNIPIKYPKDDTSIIEAALGMTYLEAENAFSLSLVEENKFDVSLINREKASIVKKTGLLEVIPVHENIQDIGGLDKLKSWLTARSNCFTSKAKEFGIKPPKGMLISGIPGTGKSLTAKVTANILKRPLLRLDMGKVFGSYVGESESNIRRCLDIAEAVAPSCLWLDEIEKSFSGLKDGGNNAHETTKRVLSTFLTWMQEKTADVFIVATANSVSAIPPEMLRGGRFDKLFWVDLPNTAQRKEIIEIHLKKVKRKPESFNMIELIKASKNFTGAEIEVWIAEGLVTAFEKGLKDINTDVLIKTSKEIVPIAQLMSDDIEKSRKWASERGVTEASSYKEPIKIEVSNKRKMTAG